MPLGGSFASGVRTFGVEEELLLVDAATAAPVAAATAVLASAELLNSVGEAATPPAGLGNLSLEAKEEQIEAVTPPCTSLNELANQIVAGRSRADAAARLVDARAVALATSVQPLDTHLVPVPRYRRMMDRFGITMREQFTCGFHVHVAIESPDEGVAVLDRIRCWLPVLLALSSNSPYWQGMDTGYSSYRYQAWSRWPTAGPTDIFGSATEYHRAVRSALDTGVPLDDGMVYFDARLSRRYPTVEIRIADVCMEPDQAVLVAALARALVETAVSQWRAGEPPVQLSTLQLSMASWMASKSGVSEDLVHPLLCTPCPAPIALQCLFDQVRPALADHGEEGEVERLLGNAMESGTGADRQRLVMAETGSAYAVVRDALGRTHRGADVAGRNLLPDIP
jgi:carboxylate-amine ligase